MKNIILIATLSTILISTTSCEIDNWEDIPPKKTEAAYMIYSKIKEINIEQVKTIDFIQKIDLYLQANEKDRVKIKFNLLQGYDILEVGTDTVHIEKDYLRKWTINRNSTASILTPLTEWKITSFYSNIFPNYENNITITSQLDANTWHIDIIMTPNYDNITSNASLIVKLLTNNNLSPSKITNNYSIETRDNETFIQNNNDKLFVSYKTESPLIYSGSTDYFINGKLDINVIRPSNNKTDNITTEILKTGFSSITFRGITEIW